MRFRGRIAALVVLFVAVSSVAGAAAGRSQDRTAQSSLAIYLVRGEKVSPVLRLVPRTSGPVRRSLLALLRGPTGAERRTGYRTAVPSRTLLRDLSLKHGLLTVDLSSRFQSGGGSLSMQLRAAQVVFTATQFPSVSRVAFRLDGRPVRALGGEGVLVDPPVGRAVFEEQAPPILLEQPLPGATVPAPLLVRGSANVFEAQLAVDVRTPSGKLLAHRDVRASAGTGTRGRFSVRIPLSGATGKVVVVAYSRSAKNGARINVVRTPITLRPQPATEQPASWKRCSNAYHGFSIAYPASWHVASYDRLHVLGKGEAHRRQFFRHMVCLNYDPEPFTVYEATEGPQTAVLAFRLENAREFRRESRSWFHDPSVRTIERNAITVGGHPAIRFHVYLRRGVLWDRSHVYGYLIDFGRDGGVVVEAWRYGSKPIPWRQYRSHMAVLDRMAPTVRLATAS